MPAWLVLSADSILGLLCALFLILVCNLLTFYRLPRVPRTPAEMPLVSLLVPARNEEDSIEHCVRSLLQQDYRPLEILVLDDQSTDATPAILQRLRDELAPAERERLHILQGEALPPGWVGKNFACHQLARQAQGTYLLFTDADTVHAPALTTAVISTMQRQRAELLTAQPAFVLGSLAERLIVPLLNFTILTLLPVALVRLLPTPSLATGNGQLLCFHRSAYSAIGGHAAVKGQILEDVLLARAVKAAGRRMTFVDAFALLRCRMYDSWQAVWQGFSKNLFALYNYSLPFAACAILLNLALFVAPVTLVLASPLVTVPHQLVLLALAAYLLTVAMRILLTLRFAWRQRWLLLGLCFLHPIAILIECLILLNSIRWHYRRAGTPWKGRYYA